MASADVFDHALVQQRIEGASRKLSCLQSASLTSLRRQSVGTNNSALSPLLRRCSADSDASSPFLPTPRSLSGLSNCTGNGTDSDTATDDSFNPITSALRRTTRTPLYVHPYYWTHIHRKVLLSLSLETIDALDLSGTGSYDSDCKDDEDAKASDSDVQQEYPHDDLEFEEDDEDEEEDENEAAIASSIHIPTPSVNQYDRAEAITEFEAGPTYSLPSIDDSLCSILKSALWSLSDDGNNGDPSVTKNPSIFLEDEDALWNRGCPPKLDFSFCGDEAPLPVDAVLKLRYPFQFEEVPILAVIDRSEHLDRRYRYRKRDRSKKKMPWPDEHRWDVPFSGIETLDPYFLAVLLSIAQAQRSVAEEHGQEMDCYTAHVMFPYTWIPPAPSAPPLPPRYPTSHPILPSSLINSPTLSIHTPPSPLSPFSHSPLSPLSPLIGNLPPPPPLPSNPLLPNLHSTPRRHSRSRSIRLPPESSPYPFHSCQVVTVSARISDSYLDLLTKPSSPSSDSPSSLPYPYPSFADGLDFKDEEPFFRVSMKKHTMLSREPDLSMRSAEPRSVPVRETSWFLDDRAPSCQDRELVEEKELLEHIRKLVGKEAVRWTTESHIDEPLLMATPPISDDENEEVMGVHVHVPPPAVAKDVRKKRPRSGIVVSEEERVKIARIIRGF